MNLVKLEEKQVSYKITQTTEDEAIRLRNEPNAEIFD